MKISILIQYRSTFNKSQHVRIKFLLSFHIYFRNSIGLSIYHTSSKNSALLKYSAPLDSIGPSSFSKGHHCFSLLSFYLGHSAPILDKIHVESCTQRSPKHRKFADFFLRNTKQVLLMFLIRYRPTTVPRGVTPLSVTIRLRD